MIEKWLKFTHYLGLAQRSTDSWGWMGITDITAFRVEGLRFDGIKETAFEKGIQSIEID
jgi:hypothetical protein